MKNVLITGCSSGYGRATAEMFLENGWNVIATMRSPEKASGLPASDRLCVLRLDVTDEASVDAAVRDAIVAFGGIDVLVNNAGIGLLSAFEATPRKTVREIFDTNTFGVMAVTQAVIPHFRERRAGTLINVTSSVAFNPSPLCSVYIASKFAIEGFTESLAHELAYFGIRTKLVEPGYGPNTAFIANAGERMRGLVPPAYAPYVDEFMRGQVASKSTNAPEVARAVLLAATDGSQRLRYPAGADAEEAAAALGASIVRR